MIRKILLWVFGLVPAAAWLAYTVFMTVMVLLAAPSALELAVAPLVFAGLTIWSMTTIILVILNKAAKHARYGLIVAIIVLAPLVLNGISGGVEKVSQLLWFCAALSLLIVSIYLLWSEIQHSRRSSTNA